MSKSILISVLCCLFSGLIFAQDWVIFTQTNPEAPIINLTQSDNLQVEFTVEVCGMYKNDITEGSENFQRIDIPGAGKTKVTGEPELPYIRQLIAIPECDSVVLTVNITGQTDFINYNIYPAPDYEEVQNPDGTVYLQEVFTKNEAVYAQNVYLPGMNAEIVSTGYLRGQKYAEVYLYPVQFNPVTQHINVYTNYQILLNFINPTTAVNINTGIFNNVASNTMLNYVSSGITASINDNVQGNGNIQWKTLTDTIEACTILVDYLIICANSFFEPNNIDSKVLRIANHRATYNGFDVAIINVENILLLDFEYTNPVFEYEQKIRTCIRRIYEGANAQHTYDGKLGYVLLIGDVDAGNLGMPSSYEDGITKPSDYYFSCITKENGVYDQSGDLYIGRFCVDNNLQNGLTELHNIVEKTIYFESECSFGDWRNNVAHANGNSYNVSYFSDYYDFIQDLLFEENLKIENYYLLNGEIYQPVIDMLNEGAPVMMYEGHGEIDCWQDSLNIDSLEIYLSNKGQFPYVTSRACRTGWFDHDSDCLGEALTTYSVNKGFVGFLGAARVHMNSTSPSIEDPPIKLQERIPYSIWHGLSFITGEFILETKIGIGIPGTAHLYNFFGDPALNIMADGFEITSNLTPDCSPNLTISTEICIRTGASLTIPADCELYFEENGALYIDDGGSLIINQDATIYGTEEDNAIYVSGNITIESGVEFSSLQGTIWKGLVFQNEETDYSFTNAFTMQNCGISGYSSSLTIDPSSGTTYFINSNIEYTSGDLEIRDCNFTNSTIDVSNPLSIQSDVTIDNCTFDNAVISTGASIFIDGYDSYQLTDNVIDFADGDGISIFNATHYSEYNLIHKIKDNTITFTGTKTPAPHKAIEIYNSIAEIETNTISDADCGIAAMNNALIKIKGDENASINSGTQQILDNTMYQAYFRQNSYPQYFHYNVIENNINNNAYVSNDSKPPVGEYLDIEENCFDNDFNPTKDLLPLNAYDYLPYWCPSTKASAITTGVEALYDSAYSQISAGNYNSAELIFKQIISDYPLSREASSSVKSLFSLLNLTDSNYASLKSYYQTEPNLQSDSVLYKLSTWFTAHCDTRIKNYQDAISFFENVILNPDTITDSTFAIIDLGYVYIAMLNDSLCDNYGLGTMPQYIPKSYKQYDIYRQYLIDLLFINESVLGIEDPNPLQETETGILSYFKIIPNPVSNQAEIKFSLKENSRLKICIFDISGSNQIVFVDQMMKKGNHILKLNARNFSNGLYFISIYTNASLEKTEKLIINK